MTVKRMDKVGIAVEDIDVAIAFLSNLALSLRARALIQGDWARGEGMRIGLAQELGQQISP